jgi:NAD(P)-dependent dehydrogenase (short-subunit alcohol dehydrogenase family)
VSLPPPGCRAVLVTGGGSGIGLAVAKHLMDAGGRVALTGRRTGPLEALAARYPGRAFAGPCDLADPKARAGLVARAREALGELDGLVHCAGMVVHQPPGHIDDEALRAQLEVNLIAPLRLGEEALQVLPRGGGMVFIASTLARRPILTSAAYSASKAGLLQAMRVLALAGAPKGVRANAVLPGVVNTELVRTLRLAPGEAAPEGAERAEREVAQLAGLANLHPLGRVGRTDEVAEAVQYLLGAAWTTGAELVVDGGLMLRE